jgi:transcriptional regulator with XRE-family HTH domain
MITGEQVTAARKLLGWSKVRLAARANQSEATVALLEAGQRRPRELKVQAIRETLEFEGIEFTQVGTTLRNRKAGT